MEERTIVNTMGTSAPEVANEKRRLFGSFCEADNALCYRLGAERLFITPWGENSFRVTSTKCAAMPEERWALTEEVKPVQAQIRIEEMQASITNGRITAVINNVGKIEYRNEKGELLLEEYLRNKNDMHGSTTSSLMIDAREFKPLIGGDEYALKVRFVSNPSEKIYGMGQYHSTSSHTWI